MKVKETIKMPLNAGHIGERIMNSVIWGEGANLPEQKRLLPANMYVKGKKYSWDEFCELFKK